MKYIKIFWVIRAFIYKLVFKSIGKLSYLGKPLLIYNGNRIQIGNNVRIFPGMRAECHNNGEIVIKDNVAIAQNFHIISSRYPLIIERDTTISGNVFITNIDHEYQNIGEHILKQPYIEKETRIGENCFIGYGAAIQAGTILGKQCVVGTSAVVRGVYPDYSVIVGVPGKVTKRYVEETRKWEKTSGIN